VKHAAGLRAIIAYKLTKAVLEGAVGALLVVLLLRGPEATAATIAQFLIDHVPSAATFRAATMIVLSGTRKHVRVAAMLTLADAVLSAIEGMSLERDWRFGPWLVVFATGALLPIEAVELARKGGWLRAVVLAVNAAVVAYLVRDVGRQHARRAEAGRAGLR
jgi:uncharacterized membrane protein (DUF2068 family)